MIDPLAEMWDAVVTCMSAELLRIDLMIARLTAGIIFGGAAGMMVLLVGEVVELVVDMFAELWKIAVPVVAITLEDLAPLPSYLMDARADVMIGKLLEKLSCDTTGIRAHVSADVNANVRIFTGTAFGSMPTLSASEKALPSACSAPGWWSTTSWNFRRLQARIPSYHVHMWPTFTFLMLPQLPNQEPPCPQQLSLPDFRMRPHFGHATILLVVLTDGMDV